MFHNVPWGSCAHICCQGGWTPRAWGVSVEELPGVALGAAGHTGPPRKLQRVQSQGQIKRADDDRLSQGKNQLGKRTEPPRGALAGGGRVNHSCWGLSTVPTRACGRRRQRAALLVSGFTGPARKRAPRQWGRPQAGGFTEEGQPPCSSRGRHAYWANRVLCLRYKGGHAGASFPQSSTASFPTGPEQRQPSGQV